MKVGITGANGHVGANLLRRLLKDKHEIRVLQYNDHEAFDGLDVEVVIGELGDPESLLKFSEGLDIIYHLAAKISIGNNSYDSLYQTNLVGTKNLVAAAKKSGVKRFIHFSSIHALVHEPLDQPLDENNPSAVHSPLAYERTKSLTQEWIVTQQATNFDVIILNPTAIFGPYDFKLSLLGQFLVQIYTNKLPALIPGGYNWVDVRDVCEAAANAMYQGKGGEKYLLSGTFKSVIDFAALIGHVMDVDIKTPVIPLWVARMGVPFIYAWSKVSGKKPIYTRQSLDILQMGNANIINTKARKELGFNPRPLADSIKDTLEWFKENNYISK